MPGLTPFFAIFSIIAEVAAISTSFVTNPLATPSTCIRNFSPSRKIFSPTFDIPFTISSKLFGTCLAIATPLIPNKLLIVDDGKTGSSVSTTIISPSCFIL